MSDCDEPNAELWIRSPDDRGNVVDQRLIEAAHQVWPRARKIVAGILGSDEDAPRIVELVVHQASRALERNGPVATPQRYLITAVKRESLRELKDRQRFVPLDQALLERLHPTRWKDSEDRATFRILVGQLKERMDDKTRRLFELRCLGHGWEHIAKALKYHDAHSAEVQFRKGVNAALQRLKGKRLWPTMLPRKDSDADDRS
jgi:DNA-directed RNA polymerase specialized sigma24 family protein